MDTEVLLHQARERSAFVLDPVPDEVLVHQHSPLMSPLVWDIGHVANYEEQWLIRALTGQSVRTELDPLYDAFRHPRRDRHALEIPGPVEARAYAVTVRDLALDVLDRLASLPPSPLTVDGFVHRMVVQHEHQHIETMLAALQLLPSGPCGYRPARAADDRPGRVGDAVLLPGGTFMMGTSVVPGALDNERPAHPVSLDPFWLDATPVTNAAYRLFVASGEGRPPQDWIADGAGGWFQNRFGHSQDIVEDEPVQHISWEDADAFARWGGKRLPTEAEWEFAATNGGLSPWPWGCAPPTAGLADLWFPPSAFGPSVVGAHPGGRNRWGIEDLIGGVWEWTSSSFAGYPGFVAWPYREYSEVFFGPEYKVLRGGSWATHDSAMRGTFRNWDYPIRRQIFAGVRCAKDA